VWGGAEVPFLVLGGSHGNGAMHVSFHVFPVATFGVKWEALLDQWGNVLVLSLEPKYYQGKN